MGITYTPLKTVEERKLWLSSGDKRITIHFVPFHGSWLNMIEIWFSLLEDKCLKNGWFQSVEALDR
ncbi:MAG: transposase, partial [Actinomycetia bacterium]|nr:transposase [Actinomycetes bacterium]